MQGGPLDYFSMLTGREFSRHNPEVRNTNAGLPFSAHCVEVRWIVLSSGIYKNGNRTPLRNLRHTFLDYLLAGKINTSFQNSLHFIVERCRSLSPHMPTRTSALQRIGRVIILHDPFFSRAAARRPQGRRAAASEESMVVSTVQATGVVLRFPSMPTGTSALRFKNPAAVIDAPLQLF